MKTEGTQSPRRKKEKLSKCRECGKVISFLSSERTNLPDSQKCRCPAPGAPPPPFSALLKSLGL
jgi:hypothetical protein